MDKLFSKLKDREELTIAFAKGAPVAFPDYNDWKEKTPLMTRAQKLEGIVYEMKCLFCGKMNSFIWSYRDKKFCNRDCWKKFHSLPVAEKLKLRERVG